MNTFLSSVCSRIEKCRNEQAKVLIELRNFIQTTKISEITLSQLNSDPSFGNFSSILTNNLATLASLDPVGKKPSVELSMLISFTLSILSSHPFLKDKIAQNLDGDNFFQKIFANFDSDCLAPLDLLPRFKLTASLLSSKLIPQLNPITSKVILDVIIRFQQNDQLCAWVNSILSFVFRRSPTFHAILLSDPSFCDIISALVEDCSSNDSCIACSALSAMSSISPSSLSQDSALRAAVRFATSESLFSLMKPLSVEAIYDLSEFVKLGIKEIALLINEAIRSNLIEQYYSLSILEALCDYDLLVIEIIKQADALPQLLSAIVRSEFGSGIGVSLIRRLQFVDSTILEKVPEATFFSILSAFNPDKAKIVSPILLKLMCATEPTKSFISKLTENSNEIFTEFIREIREDEKEAAIPMFLFLSKSSEFISAWELRLRTICFDTKFASLAAAILIESASHDEIDDAISSLEILLDKRESHSPQMRQLIISEFARQNAIRKEESMKYEQNCIYQMKEVLGRNSDLIAQNQKIEKIVEKGEKQNRLYSEAQKSLESTLALKSNEYEAVYSELGEAKMNLIKSKMEAESLSKAVEKSKSEIADLENQRNKLKVEVQTLRNFEKKAVEYENENAELREKMKRLNEIKKLQNSEIPVEAKRNVDLTAMENIDKQIDDNELIKVKKRASKEIERSNSLKNELRSVKDEMSRLRIENDEVVEALTKSQYELKKYKQKCASEEGNIKRLKTILKFAESFGNTQNAALKAVVESDDAISG